MIASYDVFIPTGKDPTTTSDASEATSSRLLLLQYPAHRPKSRPYNAAQRQKPRSLRFKPGTGHLEVDIPILKHEHYNEEDGARYEKALNESKLSQSSATFGLAAGFSTSQGRPGLQGVDLRDIPAHDDAGDSGNTLDTLTLGGKIATPTTRDPIYMVGTFDHDRLYLSQLDAVVQARPQLHHLDAQDDINQRRTMMSLSRGKQIGDIVSTKLESKAVDVKLKDTRDDGKDRGLNANARLLKTIQQEEWQCYDWTDQHDNASRAKFSEIMRVPSSRVPSSMATSSPIPHLKAAITNSEWLDKMSAPRETGHGKKGLLAKLRGREREKARRKKNEEEKKRQKMDITGEQAAPVPASTIFDQGSDSSELSSLSHSESDEAEDQAGHVVTLDLTLDDEVEIKEEPPPTVTTTTAAAAADAAPPAAAPPSVDLTNVHTSDTPARRRGRPTKRKPEKGPVEADS